MRRDVGWAPDLQVWTSAWHPTDLRGADPPRNTSSLSALTRAALDSLLVRVNLSTGIAHPSDRDAAAQLLYILRDAGEAIEPNATRAYLLRGVCPPVERPHSESSLGKSAIGAKFAADRSPCGPATSSSNGARLRRNEEDVVRRSTQRIQTDGGVGRCRQLSGVSRDSMLGSGWT